MGSRATVSDLALIGGGLGPRLGPVRNEAPAQQVERALAGVVVLADGPQLLAWGRVVAGRHVREARVGHVEAAQDCDLERTFGLDGATAHQLGPLSPQPRPGKGDRPTGGRLEESPEAE